MKFFNSFLLLALLSLLASCGNGSSTTQKDDKALLDEAAKVHQEAITTGMSIAPRLAALRQLKNSINVQGRALSPQEISLTTAIEGIEERHKYWQSHLVEVPGHEHHHHGGDGHNHHHDHSPPLDVTAEQMLLIQKEIRDSILVIREGIEEIEGLIE